MTALTPDAGISANRGAAVTARPGGFIRDVLSVAGRAVRALPREPEAVIPALLIPVFFFFVNTGSLTDLAESSGTITDFKAFQLPVSIVFAVTGISRAAALVTDIQGGYFDRLLVTPIKRPALLLGLMVADFVLVILLGSVVTAMGLLLGIRFETGVLGIAAFLVIGALWGLAFAGFSYAIALKTGNPAAVNSAFLLFFPFAFISSTFLPVDQLSGWMQSAARVNPVTYLFEGLRALILEGWVWSSIGKALLAIAIMGLISFSLAFAALKGRVAQR